MTEIPRVTKIVEVELKPYNITVWRSEVHPKFAVVERHLKTDGVINATLTVKMTNTAFIQAGHVVNNLVHWNIVLEHRTDFYDCTYEYKDGFMSRISISVPDSDSIIVSDNDCSLMDGHVRQEDRCYVVHCDLKFLFKNDYLKTYKKLIGISK